MARKRMIWRIDAYYLQRANCFSEIVTSRKRKLREFFAVCDNEGPIPQIKYPHADAPATSVAENRFLEVTDILKYVQHGLESHIHVYRSWNGAARVVGLTCNSLGTGSSMNPIYQRVVSFAPKLPSRDHRLENQVQSLEAVMRRERRRPSVMGRPRGGIGLRHLP
jgi:hypothetical protein